MKFPEKLGVVFTISLVFVMLTIIYFFMTTFFPSLACFAPTSVCDLVEKVGDWVSLIVGLSAITIAVATYIQDKKINNSTKEHLENIGKDILEIRDFEIRQRMHLDEILSKQKVKQQKYANAILASIRFTSDYLDSIKTEQRFRKLDEESKSDLNRFAKNRTDTARKNSQIKHYERMQEIFLGLKIDYDAILDIFDEKIEEYYRKAWISMSTSSDLYKTTWDNTSNVDKIILQLEIRFKKLYDSLLPYGSKTS